METDFPAAHSMDASWYAVDGQGNVALFHTGAGGAVPNDAYSPDNAEYAEEMGLDPGDFLAPEQLPKEGQLFVFETGEFDEALTDRYHRKKKPKKPMHIDELPPEVREILGDVRFDTLDFNKDPIIQPVELMECGTWDPAYLTSDGKTVKPVPGREKEYAEFYKSNLVDLQSDNLTVEEPKRKKRSTDPKKKTAGS